MSARVTRVFGLSALAWAMGCGRPELPADLAGCSGDEVVCAGHCVDPKSDELHCGGCGEPCAPGEACRAGHCDAAPCDAGLTACGGVCIDVAADAFNCGACGVPCPPGTACRVGRCENGTDCPPGASACGDECVLTDSDPRHCGACFNPCPAGAACVAGRCDTTCAAGLVSCGADCVDTAFDPAHCGGCGVSCAFNEICTQGRCVARGCAAGLVSCGAECVDLGSNPEHCGACYAGCPSSASCAMGRCVCSEPDVLCDGACVDTSSDAAHCGACDSACAEGATCVAGECIESCGDLRVQCEDGCVNLDSDVNHCGACDAVCEGSERCVHGTCEAACDWDLAAFPIPLNDTGTSVGDLTFDLDCNLYVGKQPGAVLRVDFQSHEVELLKTVETYVRGIVFRPEDGLLYFSSQDRVHRMSLDGSDFVELENTNVGQHLNGMTLAPAGWGELGRQLILARSDGLILAIDPDEPVPTVIAELTPFVSDLEFDGQTLYVAAYSEQRIMRVDPDGQVTVFAEAPCAPDGITVAPGSDLFIACGDTNELYAYSFSSGSWAFVSDAALNGLWAPSGLLWDGTDTLIVLEEVTDLDGAVLRGYGP